MNALEIVKMAEVHATTGGLPFQSGFDRTADIHDNLPSLLECANLALQDLADLHILQCYREVVLTIGARELKLPPDILKVYELYFTDTVDGREFRPQGVLRSRLAVHGYSRRTPYTNRKPRMYSLYGQTLSFDSPVDKAYKVTLYADVVPTLLAAKTDIPTAPALPHHRYIAIGAAYHANRIALRHPDRQKDMEPLVVQATAQEWERGKQVIAEVAASRAVGQVNSPLFVNTYAKG